MKHNAVRHDPPLRLLLLCNDPAWEGAARNFVSSYGGTTLDIAATPNAALRRLVRPGQRYTHVLIEPSASGTQLTEVLGLSADDADSGISALLLGPARLRGTSAKVVPYPRSLAMALMRPAGPPLAVTEAATPLEFAHIECRFQPIVALADRRLTGVETLVRLHHPQQGVIGPDRFVPQIEHAGLSLQLTEAVAAHALAAIDGAFLCHNNIYLTLNLPLDVLLLADAVKRIDGFRITAGIRADQILIELTESRPVGDVAALAGALLRWREAGYRAAIDDIGPDMRNQIALFDLPFGTVKLDKEVVARSQYDYAARDYLRRTVESAKAHALAVIAEGVESDTIWRDMLNFGVDEAQGFLISRPLPAAALALWLEEWTATGCV